MGGPRVPWADRTAFGKFRIPAWMHELEESGAVRMEYSEIAAELRTSESAVRRTAGRAAQKLERRLRERGLRVEDVLP